MPVWLSNFLSTLPSSRLAERILLGLVLVLCAVGNLPWHLDNYDQAKQAFVSYEIEQGGSWWFQHTPRGDTATKPPLAGWVSLAFYKATGSWDFAWRAPGFLCTIALLVLLAREARRILPDGGALLVICAFGLNLLTPRIATLVRTDMMLTLWITLCGWLIYRKVSTGEAWRTWEKWTLCAVMTAAFFTKGPILYAFILPGMVAFFFLAPKDRRRLMWGAWWAWAIPLALFVGWGVAALMTNQEFYNDVVVKEFYSRFDQSLKAHERQQPIWFYLPHLLHKFAPWSVLALALPLASGNVRKWIKTDPGTLWLACWAIGGLLCMTFIPSKRVDRIFPVIPPLCLLLVAMVSACRCGPRVRAWCGAAVVAGVLMAGGYFVTIVIQGYLDRENRMALFGQKVQELTRAAGIDRVFVVEGKDEAMLLYAGGSSYFTAGQGLRRWNEGRIDALLIPERRLDNSVALPPPALNSGLISKNKESAYLLYIRPKP